MTRAALLEWRHPARHSVNHACRQHRALLKNGRPVHSPGISKRETPDLYKNAANAR